MKSRLAIRAASSVPLALAFPALLAAVTSFGCSDKPGPEAVHPDDSATATPPDGTSPAHPDTPDDLLPDTRPGAPTDVSGIWVEDQNGVEVGLLVRRGSDDQIASRAIYDIVTVFHPQSALFFEITMSDGIVRYPQNTFFSDFDCAEPVGVGVGTCTDCKAGYGAAFLHAGHWWQLAGGTTFATLAPGSLYKGGLGTECIAHGTSNAKGFAVRMVSDDIPPTSFAPPLRFVAR